MLKADYDIKVIEWSCIAWNFIVQKERIRELVGDKNLITLQENKDEIFSVVDNFSPDIIFMEEFPEFFIPDEITGRIYDKSRPYLIFECTHDSAFSPDSKRWIPDKFVFVSAFTALRYLSFDVPCELIEYPIDLKVRDKNSALSKLGLDPSYSHVVNVGLFTPRKNQSYVFEIAKLLKNEKIMFHFIGNQADNFKWYWEPLLNEKPDNCVVWGERSDVDTFLQACDCFFFASEGKKTDKELNPIAIKEAIEYNLPILMYNLDVYCGKYNGKENIWYLTGDTSKDSDLLKESLKNNNTEVEAVKDQTTDMKEMFDVSFNTEDNRMDFYYHGENTFECSISMRDSLSKAPIYWFNWDLSGSRGFYATPIPREFRDFGNDPNFKGFTVEFYYKDSETMFFSKDIVTNNNCISELKQLNFNPFDCYFVNYREFFVDGQFDSLPFSDLNLVVDIGANTGLFTKYLYSRGCKRAILVEADPRLRNNIVRMLDKDYEKSVILMNPIFSERSDVDFWYSEKNTTIGKLGEPDYNDPNERELNKKISTRSIVFDDVLEKTNGERISLLKCDIQGGEYPLFDSLRDDQIKLVDNYIIEFHSNNNGEINTILQKLEKNGYEYRITNWNNDKWESFDESLFEGMIFASQRNRDTKELNSRESDVSFDVSFESETNKINFLAHGDFSGVFSVSIKDITSNAPIYCFKWDLASSRGFFAIPKPIEHMDFISNPSFRGFRIDFYKGESEDLFYTSNLIVNENVFPVFPCMDFPPFDCSYNNYSEFFIEDIFKDFHLDNLETVVDIGANIGLFTKYLFNRGCKRSVMVEADPRLERNIFRILGDDAQKADVIMSPIFSEKKDVEFYFSESNSTIGSLNKPNVGLDDLKTINSKTTLRSITFSDVLETIGVSRISLLKCDIQGGEYDLFNSLTDDQIRRSDNYIIEFHSESIYGGTEYGFSSSNRKPENIISKLEKNGYETLIVTRKNGAWVEDLYREDQNATILASRDSNFFNSVLKVEDSKSLGEKSNKPLRIKAVHFQTTRNDEREIESRNQISQLKKYGIEYVLHVNEPYLSLPPSHNCLRPSSVSLTRFKHDDPMGGGALTPGHYGCYEAHRIGILSEFDDDIDFLLVFEGDCFIEVPLDEFANSLFRAARICRSEGIDYFSFGDTNTLDHNNWRQSYSTKDLDDGFCFLTNKIICTQSVMFNSDARDFLLEKFRTHAWDTIDVYYNVIFGNSGRKMGIVSKRLTRQLDGYSLIDSEYKVYRK